MLKKLALAVMMACGAAAAQNVTAPATLDPGQIYSTGNIVQQTTTTSGSTWVNGVYQDQLTCWAWGDPGYCGPNAIVRPGNYINFSFGTTDLHQVQAIANVLPGSGSGLRVNGYNFGFTAKNGNGWDGGGLDTLSAYVNFSGSDGKSVRYDYYDLNWKFDWTTFNYNKTFDIPFAAKDLGNVRYGFVGRDNNFWAGPYGPEIMNVSFGLTYSVDPCAKDPLYSPTCPGYMDALNKLLPSTTSTPVAETADVAPSTTATVVETAPMPTVSSAPAPASAPAVTSTTTSTAAVSTPSTATRESAGGSGTAAGLAVVARNQQREQAIAAQAVQTATTTAAAAAAAAQQEAASVAAQAVASSMGFAATQSSSAAGAGGQGIRTGTATVQTGPTLAAATTSATPTVGVSLSNSASLFQQSQSTSIQTETASALPNNVLLDRSNPLNEFFEPRVAVPQSSNNAFSGPAVNRNVSDNEAAGGVDINRMALAPQGYGDYLNFTLRDAAFYAPREVYRNQRTVDNARALRQLTNDGRHREMVEQQYRR